MKAAKIKIQDIPNHISGLAFDGNSDDLRLHYDGEGSLFSWTALNEDDYSDIETKIDVIGSKHKAFDVYAWCDISGFDYWVRRQEEPNYIQISVSFNKKSLTPKELSELSEAVDNAVAKATSIAYLCESNVMKLFEKGASK